MSRQQRRARDREAAKAQISTRVTSAVSSARTIQAMWLVYRRETLPADLPEGGEELMRRCFYSGVAGMLELMMRVSADGVSEDQGVEMLARLHEELETFTKGLGH